MAKWTKEYTEEMKNKVRSVLVRKPNASKYELAKILDINNKTAWKLKKKVQRENLERVDSQKIEGELAKIEAEYEALALECWRTITDNVRKIKTKNEKGEIVETEVVITTADKARAIKNLIEIKKTLFNVKFDSGLFSRKIGEIDVNKKLNEEEEALIKKAIEYARPKEEDNK